VGSPAISPRIYTGQIIVTLRKILAENIAVCGLRMDNTALLQDLQDRIREKSNRRGDFVPSGILRVECSEIMLRATNTGPCSEQGLGMGANH